MKQKYFVVLLAIEALHQKNGAYPTVGEIARFLNVAKSTVRNRVEWLFGAGLAVCEKVQYKSTGKYLVETTHTGKLLVIDQKVMF